MALPDLAASADLSARGITVTTMHEVMLSVASSLVRQAAGGPILATEATVTLWGFDQTPWLDLPGCPVTEVTEVEVDGTTLGVDVYKLVDGRLWRYGSWGNGLVPVQVTVTMTVGLTVVPPAIVQLVCDLAILGATASTEGAHDPRVISEQIDDYKVTFSEGAGSIASAMEIPTLTRQWLRAQFGGGAGVTTLR